MTGPLDQFLRAAGYLAIADYPLRREGRLVRFLRRSSSTLGRPDYYVFSARGNFDLGRLEFRNQWGMYSYIPLVTTDVVTPYNTLMLAEIYAMLKELDGR